MEQLVDLNSKHCFVANVPVVSCDVFLGAFIKRLGKTTHSFVVSIPPHATGSLNTKRVFLNLFSTFTHSYFD